MGDLLAVGVRRRTAGECSETEKVSPEAKAMRAEPVRRRERQYSEWAAAKWWRE